MLNDKLKNIGTYPFHMPGHKRNKEYDIAGSSIDVTEIDGLDDLHNPTLDIKDIEDNYARLAGCAKSIISVNGSTCGILAAISAVCSCGDKILIARNCHKSVYNACYINKLRVEYIIPEFDSTLGIYTRISQEAVDKAISDNPDAKAIVITSPTYEGFISRVTSPLPIIIDSAHGAHFGLAEWLPEREVGDIVIQSLHKTLPSLTQTAVINIYNDKYIKPVKKYMDIYESSSPSYILLASIEKCYDYICTSNDRFDKYKCMLDSFYRAVDEIKGLHILKNDDITRIVISFDGMSGTEIAEHLRNNGIEPEGSALNYVILISTVCDTQDGFDTLISALRGLKRDDCFKPFIAPAKIPEKACEAYEITDTEICPIDEAIGKVSGSMIYAYPPAMPIINTGEIIDENTLAYIKRSISAGVNIIDTDNLLPDYILTKAEQ